MILSWLKDLKKEEGKAFAIKLKQPNDRGKVPSFTENNSNIGDDSEESSFLNYDTSSESGLLKISLEPPVCLCLCFIVCNKTKP